MKASLLYKVNATIILLSFLLAATSISLGSFKGFIYFTVVALLFLLGRGFAWLFEQLFPTTEETEEN